MSDLVDAARYASLFNVSAEGSFMRGVYRLTPEYTRHLTMNAIVESLVPFTMTNEYQYRVLTGRASSHGRMHRRFG